MRSSAHALKDSFNIFTENINILSLLIIISVIPQVISSVFFPVDTTFKSEYTIESVYSLLALLVSMVVGVFTFTAIVYVAIHRHESKLEDAFNFFLKYFGALAVVSILTTITIILGLVALIVPGILFAFWFSFSGYVVLVENKRGIEAMKASKKYVQGNIWSLTKRFILLVLVSAAVTVGSLIFYVPGFSVPESVGLTISTILYTILNVVGYIYMFETYKECRLKYELAQSVQGSPDQNPSVQPVQTS